MVRRNGWMAALVAVAVMAGTSVLGQESDPVGRITVTGEGRTDAAPDMATIRLGVMTEAEDARQAISDNSAAMAAVLDRLRTAGIADRDLQTSNFTVQPRWEQRPGRDRAEVTGFVAQNMLSVRVRDLPKLGAILDEVASDGANTFEGVSFSLAEPRPAEDAARRDAVADARRKAELYADAAGVELGPLLSLSEQMRFQGPVMMDAAAPMRMAAESVPIAEGEVSVLATVTMDFAIGK